MFLLKNTMISVSWIPSRFVVDCFLTLSHHCFKITVWIYECQFFKIVHLSLFKKMVGWNNWFSKSVVEFPRGWVLKRKIIGITIWESSDNNIASIYIIFPHIVSVETIFFFWEIVENSNSCNKFQFSTL